MPRIAPAKTAALDILDRLFFNQTCLLALSERLFADDDEHSHAQALNFLVTLRQRVNREVAASGKSGVAAEALRHTVYCLLEARLDDDLAGEKASCAAERCGLTDDKGVPLSTRARAFDPVVAAQLHEYKQNFFQAVITAIAEHTHGVCARTALAIASKIDVEEFREAPAVVRYRLCERAFSLDFITAPALFLSWMYRIEAMASQKFVAKWASSEISLEFKARVGLLCEFTLMRSLVAHLMGQASSASKSVIHLRNGLSKRVSGQVWNHLHDLGSFFERRSYDQERRSDTDLLKSFAEGRFDLDCLEDGAYLTSYLEYFAQNEKRCRFWNGPQHSWIGTIGAGMIRCHHLLADPNRKITRNGNNHSKCATSVEHKETVSEEVSNLLKKHGLACRPGSLYETYQGHYMKHPEGLRHRAMLYNTALDSMDLAFPASHEDTGYLATVVATTP